MPRMRLAMRSGWKSLERIHLLAGADELDRLAGDGAHRKCRAAAAVAVDAGEDDAGDADALVEILGEIDRVLAGQAVGDEQDLMRLGGGLDFGHLGHQRPRRYGCGPRCRAAPRRSPAAAPPPRRAARSAPASGRRRSGSVSMPTWRPSTASCSCAAGRLTSSEAISTALHAARRGAWRSWRWSSSCPRPAGRPS